MVTGYTTSWFNLPHDLRWPQALHIYVVTAARYRPSIYAGRGNRVEMGACDHLLKKIDRVEWLYSTDDKYKWFLNVITDGIYKFKVYNIFLCYLQRLVFIVKHKKSYIRLS